MKKSFYEFMDNYEPDNVTEQNDISVKSVKKKVMDKIAVSKQGNVHKFTKKTFTAFAAVCVAAVTGIAVTAYETGVFDKAVNFFSKNNFYGSLQELSENDYEAIRNNLKEEHIITESEGAAVELTGSMHDENVVYLFCTMTLPEGTVLPDNCDNLSFEVMNTDYYSALKEGVNAAVGLTVFFADYNTPGSNTVDFTCVVEINGDLRTDGISGFLIEDLVNLSDETLSSINGPRLKRSSIQKGKWLLPIKSETEGKSIELLNEPVRTELMSDNSGSTDYCKVEYESLKISPLSIKLSARTLNNENIRFVPSTLENNLTIVMNDGTEKICFNEGRIGGIFGSSDFYNEMSTFETPINVSEIDHVKIGDVEIKVN